MNEYLDKRALYPPLISDNPAMDLFNIVVIPCYNEPDVVTTLISLYQSNPPSRSVEVIVVLNASEGASPNVLAQNKKSKQSIRNFIETNESDRLSIHIIEKNHLPKKHVGVGLARKIGMDEAVHRFEFLSVKCGSIYDGIITCLDADCQVEDNYLQALEKAFLDDLKCPAVSINYAHKLSGHDHVNEITDYELHLRYYNQGLKYAGFPFAYHTVGSSMAVRQMAYQKQGGMNKRKAGEDFYFLHKFIQLTGFKNIENTTVYPSARVSDRVPFGTGRAIGEMKSSNQKMLTYPFAAFEDLRYCIDQLKSLYDDPNNAENWLNGQRESIKVYVKNQGQYKKYWKSIFKNSTSFESFKKRFFQWMSAFWVMKYLNDYRNKVGGEVVVSQALLMLPKIDTKVPDKADAHELLQAFRIFDNN